MSNFEKPETPVVDNMLKNMFLTDTTCTQVNGQRWEETESVAAYDVKNFKP